MTAANFVILAGPPGVVSRDLTVMARGEGDAIIARTPDGALVALSVSPPNADGEVAVVVLVYPTQDFYLRPSTREEVD